MRIICGLTLVVLGCCFFGVFFDYLKCFINGVSIVTTMKGNVETSEDVLFSLIMSVSMVLIGVASLVESYKAEN